MKEQKDPAPEPAEGNPARESVPAASRTPYRTPELVEYGPVAKLTQGTLSRNSDFFFGGFRMRNMCL